MSLAALAALTGTGWRRWSAYRAALIGGAFTNAVFGLIRTAITGGAVGAAGGTLAGYDPLAAATYVWFGQAFLSVVHLWWNNDLADRIRSGDIAVDLARPVDPPLAYLCADLGRAGITLVWRGGPTLLVGLVTTAMALPDRLLPYLLGTLSLVLGIVVSFLGRWLVSLLAFWLTEMRGVSTLYLVTGNLFSGLVVPVHWFPEWLGALASATPFPSILQTPIDVMMGHVTGAAAATAIGIQLAWATGLLVAGRLVWLLAVRRLVVQGG
ncbi:ABC transporter permease [Pseudactinotalea sp.]|uniref:ABC transporter permease n=1 Tax=Pseudactinotalea sp. TaxID=1926260 RepID=UPI003B3AA8CF